MATGSKFGEPALQRVAARHGETPANVLLAWSAKQGAIAVVTSQNAQHQRDNLALVASGSLALTPEDDADLAPLAAEPFYSDLTEDSGVAVDPLWLVLSTLHDSALGPIEALPFGDASDMFLVLVVGLLMWAAPLVAACVAACCYCCPSCSCGRRYTSTYDPSARQAAARKPGQTFEFGKMSLG